MTSGSVRVTLVRHGESDANRLKRWQGQNDSPLSRFGEAQARLLGQRLGGRRFTHVIASDLARAVATVQATGFSFVTDPAWREFDVGRWEGLTREEVARRFPDELTRLQRGEDVPLGGGESLSAFAARVGRAFDALRARLAPGDHALVVCHGGVIGGLLSRLLGLSGPKDWSLSRLSNTSLSELEIEGGRVTLRAFNDTLHLLPLGDWPGHADVDALVGLVCGQGGEGAFGLFDAAYEAERELAGAGSAGDADLGRLMDVLHARHPGQRVQLRARNQQIREWAERLIWRGAARAEGRVGLPAAGALAHVGRCAGQVVLCDYGVAASGPSSAESTPAGSSTWTQCPASASR